MLDKMNGVWYKFGMHLPNFYDDEQDIAYIKNQDALIPLDKYDTKFSDLMAFYLTHFKKIRSEIKKSNQPYKRNNYSDLLLPFRGLVYLAVSALIFFVPLLHLAVSLLIVVASPLTAAYKSFKEPSSSYKKHLQNQGKEALMALAPVIIYFSLLIRGIFDVLYTPIAWWRIPHRNQLTKNASPYIEDNKGIQRLLKKGEEVLAKSNEAGSCYSMALIISALKLKCSKGFSYSGWYGTSTLSKREQQFRNPELQSIIGDFHRVNSKIKADNTSFNYNVTLKFNPSCDRAEKLSDTNEDYLKNAAQFLAKFRRA